VGEEGEMPDGQRPNILVIWGDDIGITNLSCYSDGLMGYRTPNIDRIAEEGMRFTDSYGEQSCTAGRSAFITGQSVFRTGLSKVGIPAAPIGLPSCSSRWAMPPVSSARTTSATRTSTCRPCTASTSSSATSTT
jgi:arylsulfatase A-like enzyme